MEKAEYNGKIRGPAYRKKKLHFFLLPQVKSKFFKIMKKYARNFPEMYGFYETLWSVFKFGNLAISVDKFQRSIILATLKKFIL